MIKDLTGMKFGRLLVIKLVGVNNHRAALWLCKCDCGREKTVVGFDLSKNHTRSCGCLKSKPKHGLCGSKFYKASHNIYQRCNNPNNPDYKNYGGRGIQMKFKDIPKLALYLKNLPGYFEGASVDRIDNNANYEAGNLRWASRVEQNRNQRTNVKLNL